MSERKFTALGTASQVPTRKRNHNGYFLQWDREGFLFDPGEGTQRQMILAGVSCSQITKIFITHFHGDHCLGLAGVIQRISLDRVPHTVEIYYPASGQKYYENLRDASIYYNAAKLKECPIREEGRIFKNRWLEVSTRKLDHSAESWGYRIQEPDSHTMIPAKLEEYGVHGRDIGRLKREGSVTLENGETVYLEDVSNHLPGQSLAFVMDTGRCQNAIELARDVDLLVCESTYLSSEEEEAIARKHLTAAQAATIAQEGGAEKLILTHFSGRYARLGPFIKEASAIHPNVVAVRDGDVVEIPKRERQIDP